MQVWVAPAELEEMFQEVGTPGVSKHVRKRPINETSREPMIGFVGGFRPFLMVPASSRIEPADSAVSFFEYGRIHLSVRKCRCGILPHWPK
jgi:hypothetical protein